MSKQVKLIRYLTVSDEQGEITAHTQDEDWKNLIDNATDWIWHYAINKNQAIEQHNQALDRYNYDINNGREPLCTY